MRGFKEIPNARSVQMNLGCKYEYIRSFVRAVRLFICSFVRSFVGLFVCLFAFVRFCIFVGALRVFPAETRLTVYRRRPVFLISGHFG